MLDFIDALATSYLEPNSKEKIEELINTAKSSPGWTPLAEYRNDIDDCFKYDTVEEIMQHYVIWIQPGR